MNISMKNLLILGTLGLGMVAGGGEYKLDLATDKADAIYGKGENITFTVNLTEDGQPVGNGKITCLITGKATGDYYRESFPLDGKPRTISFKSDDPAWLMLEVTPYGEDGKQLSNPVNGKPRLLRGRIGAMVSPLEVKEAVAEPSDFDEFWQKQRAELNKVPLKAVETPVEAPERQRAKYRVFDVKADCSGGMPVSGYLTLPLNAKEKSLPAIVNFHGAGVRSANMQFRGESLYFDVNAHGIENGKSREYYSGLEKNELANYRFRGCENRDEFYFRGMYHRVMRALDYIKSRPEWNGKTLIVMGSSQGGAQSLVAAALDKDVTFCSSGIPAMGDHNAMTTGRQPGWPRLLQQKGLNDAQQANIAKTAAYYDNVNFARHIKCETYMTTGFIDVVCVPTSVYAAYNNLPANIVKNMQTSPIHGHVSPSAGVQARISEILRQSK